MKKSYYLIRTFWLFGTVWKLNNFSAHMSGKKFIKFSHCACIGFLNVQEALPVRQECRKWWKRCNIWGQCYQWAWVMKARFGPPTSIPEPYLSLVKAARLGLVWRPWEYRKFLMYGQISQKWWCRRETQ